MKYNLDKKLYLVFIALVIIAITNAVVITYNTEKSNRISIEITEVTSPTVTSLAEMENVVARSRMYITNWVYVSAGQSDKENLLRLNTIEYPRLKIRLSKLSASWNNPDHSSQLREIFAQYDKIISYEQQISRQLVTQEDYLDPLKKYAAEEILQSNIIPSSRSLAANLEKLTRIKYNESEFRHHDMQMAFFIMKAVLINLAIFIILAVLFMTYYVTNKFLKPVMRVRENILQMGRGELPRMSLSIPRNTVGEMAIALRSLINSLKRTSSFANEIGKGNFTSHFQPLSEDDVLGKSLIEMREKLRTANEEDAIRNWTAEGLATVTSILQKNANTIVELTDAITETLVNYVGVNQAAIFLVEQEDGNEKKIGLSSQYALNGKLRKASPSELGEGLIGQAILSNKKTYISSLKDPYFTINSGLGASKSCSVAIFPLFAGGTVLGALEIASLSELSEVKLKFLENISEPIAMNIFTVRSNLTTKNLLSDSIKQADELTAQKQEMRWANEELVSKSELLEKSQVELERQQDELKKAYDDLEMKAQLLEEQNLIVEDARQSLSFKAQQLEQSNKYKSAFLANMSHELRTPLNSVMILARILAENKKGNLSDKQVEHANVIHKSGNDLLMIINDILDFSKIEAGKIELNMQEMRSYDVADNMKNMFTEIAAEKSIDFSVKLADDFPDKITTDRMRLEQVIKNLVSNAIKFTHGKGKVVLSMEMAAPGSLKEHDAFRNEDKVMAISVTDTGIGIPEDKQKLVFEAFKQVDGSNSRKYGGTGLGLTISRELCVLLGGDLTLQSVEGSGSTFTIHLPGTPAPVQKSRSAAPEKKEAAGSSVPALINEGAGNPHPGLAGKTILIADDDMRNIYSLSVMLETEGMHVVVANNGLEALNKLEEQPGVDIVLMDIMMPEMDGYDAIRAARENPKLKALPIIAITAKAMKEDRQKCLDAGASDYLSKPIRSEILFATLASWIGKKETSAK